MSGLPIPGPKSPPSTAKIAEIITANEVVLDVGSQDGVRVGLRYRIVKPIEVTNPKNKTEIMVRLEYSKGLVEVTQVFENVCIARPPQRPVVSDFFGALGGIPPFGLGRTETPDLNIAPGSAKFGKEEMVIKVGDTVRLEQPPDPANK